MGWTDRLTEDGVCYYWSGDGSSFDSHIQQPHLAEARRKFFGEGATCSLRRLELEAIRHLERGVRGRSRHGVSFVAGPVMGSGADSTAHFDTAVNEAGQTLVVGVPPGEGWALAVQGDDMFAIVHPRHIRGRGGPDAFSAYATERIREYGLTYTYRVTTQLHLHDFCARIVYPTADGPVAGPVIGRALARAAWHLDWSNDGNQTLRSMAIGRLQDSYHVPFLREYFQRLLELADGPLGGRPTPGMHAARRHEYSAEVWEVLDSRYGLSPADLEEFNGLLRRVTSLPALVDWPPLRAMVDLDMA